MSDEKLPDRVAFYVETFGYEKAVELVEKATLSPKELNAAECILQLASTRGIYWVKAHLDEQRAMLNWLEKQNHNRDSEKKGQF
ncbi:MAG: hypothetical protein Q4A60_05785 [Pasteurellaceae bacterium]|nr:hypothetical protein [Pasteurellaceae bacterium]